jgi:hypothetical protein
MTAVTKPPVAVTIAPEAAALADELGVRDAMHRIIQGMIENNPHVERVVVEREDSPWDVQQPPQVAVTGYEDGTIAAADLTYHNAFVAWLIRTYPIETTRHFIAGCGPGKAS